MVGRPGRNDLPFGVTVQAISRRVLKVVTANLVGTREGKWIISLYMPHLAAVKTHYGHVGMGGHGFSRSPTHSQGNGVLEGFKLGAGFHHLGNGGFRIQGECSDDPLALCICVGGSHLPQQFLPGLRIIYLFFIGIL